MFIQSGKCWLVPLNPIKPPFSDGFWDPIGTRYGVFDGFSDWLCVSLRTEAQLAQPRGSLNLLQSMAEPNKQY